MIELRLQKEEFEPGELVEGSVSWSVPDDVAEIEVRLFWYTEGKGTQDIGVAAAHSCSSRRGGEDRFSLRLPASPWSISGRLLSVRWAVEAVIDSGRDHVRKEIVVGPNAREVRLPEADVTSIKKEAAIRIGSRKR